MKKILIVTAMTFILLFGAVPVLAGNAGQFTELAGEVHVKTKGQKVKAGLGTVVDQGDEILTAKTGKATILFQNGNVLKVGPSSNITITKLAYNEEDEMAESAYDLAMGTVMSIVGSVFGNDDSNFEINTPSAVAGVRGTIFILDVKRDPRTGMPVTTAVGLEGEVTLKGKKGGARIIGPNQFSTTSANGYAGPPIEIEVEMFNDFMSKVSIAQDRNRVDPINIQKKANRGATSVPKMDAFAPEPIQPPPTMQNFESLKPAEQLSQGDNPSDLIYQEPPTFTELLFSVEFVF